MCLLGFFPLAVMSFYLSQGAESGCNTSQVEIVVIVGSENLGSRVVEPGFQTWVLEPRFKQLLLEAELFEQVE